MGITIDRTSGVGAVGRSMSVDFDALDPLTSAGVLASTPFPPSGVGYRWTGAANLAIRGIDAQPHGTVLLLMNESPSKQLKLDHQHTNASAEKRFACPNNSDYNMKIHESIYIRYDSTIDTGRWTVVGAAKP